MLPISESLDKIHDCKRNVVIHSESRLCALGLLLVVNLLVII